MKIRTRRIIMFTFIGAFLIMAPVLIFYASGYRLDLNRGKILKTGTLMLESKDFKDANLYIDGQLYEEEFDEKIFIYNLLPGQYDIKLEKEGYHPWQKKISINSSLTTFEKSITVFKKEDAQLIIEDNIIDFYLSPDNEKIIYIIETESFWEFYYFNITKQETELLYRIPLQEKPIDLSWSASSKKILLKYQEQNLVFNINNLEKVQDINKILPNQPVNINWDQKNDNAVYAVISQENTSFIKIDLLLENTEMIHSTEKEINPNFFVEANDIFYILDESNKNVLYKYNTNFKTLKKITELNKSQNYNFIPSTNNYLTVIDNDINQLFLIKKVVNGLEFDLSSDEHVMEFSAKNAAWDEKENRIVIYDDFEIIEYNEEGQYENFINRYGQEILKAQWYPKSNNIIILFNNRIEIIDLGAEQDGARNITKITEFDSIKNFYLDKNSEKIFFIGEIEQEQGLYQIQIRD